MLKKILYGSLSLSPLPALVRWGVECRRPRFLIRFIIKKFFLDMLKVNISEAELPLKDYPTVLSFFTRRLRPGSRPLSRGRGKVLSPVDGMVMNYGSIKDGQMLQIKNVSYSFSDLVGSDLAKGFNGGEYLTLYLSPRDYHRIHHPVDGAIDRVVAYPGRLLPVNRFSLENFREVFSRNRRVVVSYNSERGYDSARRPHKKNFRDRRNSTRLACLSCWVGALNVGEMKVLFDDGFYRDAAHQSVDGRDRLLKTYPPLPITQGNEAGCFELGSTVILVFPARSIRWLPGLSVNKFFRVGEAIAQFRPKTI